jgi:hypothetical protein
MRTSFITLALLAVLPVSAALASETCDVASEKRQSFEALAKLASDFEWTVEGMKTDDNCYELRVIDAGGNVLKVKIDPATLDVVDGKVKRFGDDSGASTGKDKAAND